MTLIQYLHLLTFLIFLINAFHARFSICTVLFDNPYNEIIGFSNDLTIILFFFAHARYFVQSTPVSINNDDMRPLYSITSFLCMLVVYIQHLYRTLLRLYTDPDTLKIDDQSPLYEFFWQHLYRAHSIQTPIL